MKTIAVFTFQLFITVFLSFCMIVIVVGCIACIGRFFIDLIEAKKMEKQIQEKTGERVEEFYEFSALVGEDKNPIEELKKLQEENKRLEEQNLQKTKQIDFLSEKASFLEIRVGCLELKDELRE